MTGMGDPSPFLWGDWRTSATPGFWVADCAACGGDLWVWAIADQPARVSCENGCARDVIEAACLRLLAEQRERQTYQDQLRATMDIDDPFYDLPLGDCIGTLIHQEPSRGFVRCPFHGAGEERTPSLHISRDTRPGVWYCHGCQTGGTIYDFAGLLWNIEPRGDGFDQIRRQLIATLRSFAVVVD